MTIIKNIKKIIPRKKIAILIELIDETSFMTKAPSSQSGDVSGLA
jgi:CRISPR/Cas system-associated endoribonuclease Cas2